MAIDRAWERIEAWLQSNASTSYSSLPGPASRDVMRALDAEVGLPLPDDLAALLSRHDGSGDFVLPIFHRLSSVRLIAKEYLRNCQAEKDSWRQADQHQMGLTHQSGQAPQRQFQYWNPSWIPFAYDESGNSLFISQVDDENFGRIGVHDKDDGGSFDQHPAFASLSALMDGIAQALSDGIIDIWGEWQPFVDDDGLLEWREPDADGGAIWDMGSLNRQYRFRPDE